MSTLAPVPLDEMVARLARVVAGSPADATEISWLEVRRGQESNGKRRRESFEYRERSVLVRVREAGRTGCHSTSAAGLSDLENAVRDALAQARLSVPVPLPATPAASPAPPPAAPALHDSDLERMTAGRARELVQGVAERGELVRFGWAEGRLAVLDSRGTKRAAQATAASFELSCGRWPGAGRAAGAARTLAALAPQAVRERALRRHAPRSAGVVGPADAAVPMVLAPEAAARLIDLLNRCALSAASFHDGTSFLLPCLDRQVLHPAISVRDDGTAPCGLPFPFDLAGALKRPVDLIAAGVALTPAVDDRLALALGRPPTPHRIGMDETMASHPHLLPGDGAEEALLAAAEGGVWVGALDGLECFDPHALRFRAVARGARRIAGGIRERALPDLLWEDDLRDVLSRVLGVGTAPVAVATGDLFLGATSAPALAVERVAGLRPFVE
jgi:predicted Zn-dependent protease